MKQSTLNYLVSKAPASVKITGINLSDQSVK
jgi:hypothetical protein